MNVRLEPGLAFGTGEHPTTRLCLRWLHARRSELAERRVMDYGTGEHPVPMHAHAGTAVRVTVLDCAVSTAPCRFFLAAPVVVQTKVFMV